MVGASRVRMSHHGCNRGNEGGIDETLRQCPMAKILLGVLSFDPAAIEACFLEQCRGVRVGLVDNEVAISRLESWQPSRHRTHTLSQGFSSSVVNVEPTPQYLTRPIIGSMV